MTLDPRHSKRFEKLLTRFDQFQFSPVLSHCLLGLGIVLYILSVVRRSSRHLWHDELFTYYIASMPSMSQFWDALKLDLNPPLSYLAARWSLTVLGDSSYAVRLPSMLGYLIAGICAYKFISFRMPGPFAVLGTLVLWTNPYLSYASEARPYAMVLGFTAIALLAWQRTLDGQQSKWAFIGLFLSVCGTMLSHLFGVFYTLPFLMAEFLWWFREKKLRLGIWSALLVPYLIPFLYLAKVHTYQGSKIPQAFQASFHQIVGFYYESVGGQSVALLLACMLGLAAATKLVSQVHLTAVQNFKYPELVFGLTLLFLPVYENLVLMRSQSGFFNRYALPAILAYSLLFVALMAQCSFRHRLAATVASCVLLMFMFQTNLLDAINGLRYGNPFLRFTSRTSDPCLGLKPDLPLVAASGLTFLEMDRYASTATKSRLYYLTDRRFAIRYANATIFEGLSEVTKHFPIQGTVELYKDFVAEHNRFLVLATPGYPEDWLIPRLLNVHADLRFLGSFPSEYKDWQVFEATVPRGVDGQCVNQAQN